MKKKLSLYQEIFLRSHIRSEIKHLGEKIKSFRSIGIDTSMMENNILELKILYHRLLDEDFTD